MDKPNNDVDRHKARSDSFLAPKESKSQASLQRLDMVLGGAILVAALALVLDGVFALLQRASVPRGVRAARSRRTQSRDRIAREALT